MFGSDWPVCLLAGTWKEVFAACTQALGSAAHGRCANRSSAGTAMRFYRLVSLAFLINLPLAAQQRLP